LEAKILSDRVLEKKKGAGEIDKPKTTPESYPMPMSKI